MWNSEEELIGVKDLLQSKWSKIIEEDTEKPESSKGNVLSGLMHAYGKSKIRKCVHWGDRVSTFLPLVLDFVYTSRGALHKCSFIELLYVFLSRLRLVVFQLVPLLGNVLIYL
jgi:hypothetical protein